ncbi:MAG: SMP-30/gluconolactonase/LRE family protein [Endozoicomonadaceae bacterium]|nr:SMP-30/gluconolactonase/LRE family protein [Endozoicomonadaceae bacterium]
MKLWFVVPVAILLIILYLVAWPVPITPTAWQAPENIGYTGDFETNSELSSAEMLTLGEHYGPEDLAIDDQERIYASVKEGVILRINPNGKVEHWAETGGRPLGLRFDTKGHLLVADAYRGVLSFDPQGRKSILVDKIEGQPVVYANAVDVGLDGTIYFSESSVKFGAEANGGTFEASLFDIMEHGGHGRLLAFDPATGNIRTLMDGLNFANGVSVSHDGQSVLVNETGGYRVLRYWLEGDNADTTDVVIDNLPGFPDNLSKGQDGRYWLGLVSPRNPVLDSLSNQPFLRKMVQRLPAFMRPKAQRYAHIIAFDDNGIIVKNLQDALGRFAFTTGVLETDDSLYLSSLHEQTIGRIRKFESD